MVPSFHHSYLTYRIGRLLDQDEKFNIHIELSLDIDGTDYIADVAVYPKKPINFLHDVTKTQELPLMVAEIISPTQSVHELTAKAEDYLQVGIKSCWLVIPPAKTVVVFHDITSDHYKSTESDLIYKVKFHGREAYLVILLEFQSTVERFMALRVLNYLTNFYMDYVASTEQVTMLPPVFPIVLYNGEEHWTAPTRLDTLIEDHHLLGPHAPRFQYCKIIERDYNEDDLLAIQNIVSTLFLTETHFDRDKVLHELEAVFQHEPDRQAVSLLLNWFRQLVLHGRFDAATFEEIQHIYETVEEANAMLLKTLEQEHEKFRQEGRQEGREEGRKQGELIGSIRVLQRILGRPISAETELLHKKQADLQEMLRELEDALKEAPFMS